MSYDVHKEFAKHHALIRKVHLREMRKIEQAFSNPVPLVCACCRRKMAEKHRVMPDQRTTLRLVK